MKWESENEIPGNHNQLATPDDFRDFFSSQLLCNRKMASLQMDDTEHSEPKSECKTLFTFQVNL